MSEPIHLDFTQYLDYTHDKLLYELADTHQAIANLAVSIGFLRSEEDRGGDSAQQAKVQRHEMEGTMAAYVEKKWLIKALIEHAR